MTRYIKWFSITLVSIVVSICFILFLLPAPPLLAGLSFSKVVYDDHHHLLRLTLNQDGKYRLLTHLSAIPTQVIQAALLQEDQYFYWHTGVNPISLFKAGWQTYLKGSRRVGASTITMQVVRLRGLNSKTLGGKIWQIWQALRLEAHYSKNQILEAYLNLAPYGGNVEGIGAASLIYFNQSVNELNLPDILTLTVIPQNPNKRTPNSKELQAIRNKLYDRWIKLYPHDKNNLALMQLPLQLRTIRSAPFLAPHFVNEILARSPMGSDEITSTLNISLQNNIQHITQHYLARKKLLGVNNAAVILLDTRTMDIKVLLGSADFFNHAIDGQINGTTVKRSPGSTLKPFIYALALDQGLIHPATVLKDVPRSFGSYNPENFDNDFVGPIEAKNALILSRNIPAVYLADQLQHPSLYEFLQKANIKDLKAESYYGLALVLGGAEMNMQELVGLYATLANAGVWKPLQLVHDEISLQVNKQRLLSPEASFLVLDMLKETPTPGANYGITESLPISVAWKTGTSSGYRDAWTIGIVGNYVLAVWIGNFNNQSNPAFIGKDIAAPLFFEIVNALKPQIDLASGWQSTQYLNIAKIEICKASGMLPTRYCTDTKETWFIPGKSPIKTDTIFREIAINPVTGLRACQFDQHTRFEIYEFWPSDLLKIFKRAGIERRTPPTYDANCALSAKNTAGFAPQIVSPQTNVSYISRLQAKDTTIPFVAVVDADVTKLHWFINETYVGHSTRDQTFLWHARPGKFIVRVVDDFGRSDARDLQVQRGQV